MTTVLVITLVHFKYLENNKKDKFKIKIVREIKIVKNKNSFYSTIKMEIYIHIYWC